MRRDTIEMFNPATEEQIGDLAALDSQKVGFSHQFRRTS